jgi:hypothetical protein
LFGNLDTLGVVKINKTIPLEIVFWAYLFCPPRDNFQRFDFSWTRIFTAKRFLSVELRPIVWGLMLGRHRLEGLVVLLGLINVAISSERRLEYFHDRRL